MDTTVTPGGDEVFSTLTSGAHNHDYALIAQPPGMPPTGGLLNHFCFYYDTRDELLRGLDLLAENGFKLELGPHKHGIGELFFCYVFEPGGNRVELQTGGYWNYIPDWEPVTWQLEQGGNLAWYVAQMPEPGRRLPRGPLSPHVRRSGGPAPARTRAPVAWRATPRARRATGPASTSRASST